MSKGKILLMDDEDFVRNVAGKILEFLGYQAITVKDGAEALALYQSHRDAGTPFDAVILDLSVPGGMGGKQAMAELLRIDPNAKGIVSSGYADQDQAEDYAAQGFTAVIAKPYELKTMGETLERTLAGNMA
jgi:CheY-like chemotaxis protein